jgi:hypothetical protein
MDFTGHQPMTIEQLRAVYDSQPFRPFVIHLADGRDIPVPSREFLSPAPNGRTFVAWRPDGAAHIVDLLLVTDLEFKSVANGHGKELPS